KGHGFDPAVNDDADQFHSVGVIDPVTGRATPSKSTSWTSVFGAEMCELAAERSDIVAITAAMLKDRKSTRLNSSHVSISYAVFCASYSLSLHDALPI